MGHNPPQSYRHQYIQARIFLNRQYPAQCDGWITAWTYCYYRSGVSQGNTYTATVAVWRFNDTTSEYNVVEGSITELMLQVDEPPLVNIYCKPKMLAPEFIAIRQGDIIGVLLPSNNAIPMVGISNLGGYQIWTSAMTLSNIPLGNLSSESRSLHLYADIGEY